MTRNIAVENRSCNAAVKISSPFLSVTRGKVSGFIRDLLGFIEVPRTGKEQRKFEGNVGPHHMWFNLASILRICGNSNVAGRRYFR